MLAMFIGPSSSGKDSFFLPTLRKYQFNPIILHTTRPMRSGEIEGESYYFITKEQMDSLEQRNLLIERRDYQTVQGIWSYATSSVHMDLVHQDYLTLNTWVGYQKFLDFYPDFGSMIHPIYFQVEDGLRLERALVRERKQQKGNYEEMCRRFLADQRDFSNEYLELYQPHIIDNNGSMEQTQAQIDDCMQLILKR